MNLSKSGILLTSFLCLQLALTPLVFSETFVDQDMATIRDLLNKINARKHAWFGLEADVEMKFKTEQNTGAGCRGKLTYLRLDEKMHLECNNKQGKTVFLFKTSDVDFELYLPIQKKLYKGNIFDLEDDHEIHSHIKPFDLYRALKPLPLNAEEITIGKITKEKATLMVWANNGDTDYVKRRVTADHQGHVIRDQFFNSDNVIQKDIMRSSYKAIALEKKDQESLQMPHDIHIIDNDSGQTTHLEFQTMRLLWGQTNVDWNINLAEDTEIFVFPEIQTAPKRQTYFN